MSLKPGNYTAVLAGAGPAELGTYGLGFVEHKVTGSSFADSADVATYERCKANGGSEEYCLSIGDNGIGFWGDNTKKGSGASFKPRNVTRALDKRAAGVDEQVRERITVESVRGTGIWKHLPRNLATDISPKPKA